MPQGLGGAGALRANRAAAQAARVAGRIRPQATPHDWAHDWAHEEFAAVTAWAVWAQEIAPPEGVEPLEWMLLATALTETFGQACERLAWYAKRWGLEIYHRILKSGCNIEDRQLAGAEVLWRALQRRDDITEMCSVVATTKIEADGLI